MKGIRPGVPEELPNSHADVRLSIDQHRRAFFQPGTFVVEIQRGNYTQQHGHRAAYSIYFNYETLIIMKLIFQYSIPFAKKTCIISFVLCCHNNAYFSPKHRISWKYQRGNKKHDDRHACCATSVHAMQSPCKTLPDLGLVASGVLLCLGAFEAKYPSSTVALQSSKGTTFTK